MKNKNIIFWGSIAYFIINGTISHLAISLTTSIDSLLQFLALTIVLVIFTTRVILPRFQKQSPQIAYFIEFAPLSLFVYLLVFSTGGLASSFLILTHLFAIGMAFLITPKVSITYVLITVFFIIFNIRSDISAQALLQESPFAVVLYILAYLVVLPFSQYIVKTYQQKEEWVTELSQMLATSKKEEERLLKNIEDPVVIISKDLTISFVNKATEKKLKFGQSELIGKKFEEVFRLKDHAGANIQFQQLPVSIVFTTKNETRADKIQISDKNGDFMRVNFRILPVIDHSSDVLGAIIIIKDYSQKDQRQESSYKKVSQKIINEQSLAKLKYLAGDLLLIINLESEATTGASSFINISSIVENKMYQLTDEAKRKKVVISCPSPAVEITPPKRKVLAPEKRCAFPIVYILANEDLLEIAIRKLLKIALVLSQSESEMKVDMKAETGIVKILISFSNAKISNEDLKLLLVKFFNNYLDIADTSDASGLEVAIAREILEKHGGSLKIEETEKGILFTATLVRHEIPNTQSEKPTS